MICWFENDSNDVRSIDNYVFLLGSISSRKTGFHLHNQNFRLGMALYLARGRDVINKTWINQSDAYLAPKKGLR